MCACLCVAAVGDDCTIKLWDIRCVVCCSMLDSKGTCMIVCVYGCVCVNVCMSVCGCCGR